MNGIVGDVMVEFINLFPLMSMFELIAIYALMMFRGANMIVNEAIILHLIFKNSLSFIERIKNAPDPLTNGTIIFNKQN
jgi:hypothetical protein